jgi:hypothetical protein
MFKIAENLGRVGGDIENVMGLPQYRVAPIIGIRIGNKSTAYRSAKTARSR